MILHILSGTLFGLSAGGWMALFAGDSSNMFIAVGIGPADKGHRVQGSLNTRSLNTDFSQ